MKRRSADVPLSAYFSYVRRHVAIVLEQARHTDQAFNTDFQVDTQVAMRALLTRIQWIQGFPDQAIITAQEAIDAALRTNRWHSICYALFMAGCPLSLWVGNLVEAQCRIDMLFDRAAGNPEVTKWAQVYAAALRLRQGNEREALVASYIEPRMQIWAIPSLVALTSATAIPVPVPCDEPRDALWSLPEVLRVDAELLLWHGASDAAAAAEEKLRRSLDLARSQGALSWELRTALSIARLKIAQGRHYDAEQALASVYNKFAQGFVTADLRSASAMLQFLSSRSAQLVS